MLSKLKWTINVHIGFSTMTTYRLTIHLFISLDSNQPVYSEHKTEPIVNA
jgi:hypothetical protein